jgi:hypothetical protein
LNIHDLSVPDPFLYSFVNGDKVDIWRFLYFVCFVRGCCSKMCNLLFNP